MKTFSQNEISYGGSKPSNGNSSVYAYQGRVSISRGQSISVIEVYS
jgi:hypothetical protein